MQSDSCFSQTTAKPKPGGTGFVADLQDFAIPDQHSQRFPQTHPVVGNGLPLLGRFPAFAGHGNRDRILVYIQIDVNYTRTIEPVLSYVALS